MSQEFLELLIAEAPAAAFESVLERALRSGVGESDLEAIRTRTALALQLREVLEHRRRREQELGALYATAGDLTSLRDVGAVLQAIVRRARELLSSDTAYLTLIDETNHDTYMRVTDGTVSAAFEHVRIELGTGLGGLVAETASPYYTTNYITDVRFAHAEPIDEAVAAEGLVAILGVPMKIADRVIGVLFAANRRERPFAPHEVTLLSSLAAHAAIAIDNARLFTEAGQALADLEAATTRFRLHSEAIERAATAHERLTTLVLSGGGLHDVAVAVTDVLGGGLQVLDGEERLLAEAGTADGCSVSRSVPIVAGAERLGTLVHAGAPAVQDVDLRTLERVALVTAVVLLNQRSVADAEQRVRGELFEDLFDDTRGDADRARRGARLLDVDLDTAHAVVVCAVPHEQRRSGLAAAAALAGDHGGIAGEHRGRVVLLLPDHSASDAAVLVVKRLGAQIEGPVTAGGDGPASGPVAIAAAHAEAERCLRAMLALGRQGQGATVPELGAYALVLSQAGRSDVDRFVSTTIGPVLDYDAAKGSTLLATLTAYFDQSASPTRAAAVLHVHPNTLYQRFDRIARLLGADWRNPDRALDVHLAVRLNRLAEAG